MDDIFLPSFIHWHFDFWLEIEPASLARWLLQYSVSMLRWEYYNNNIMMVRRNTYRIEDTLINNPWKIKRTMPLAMTQQTATWTARRHNALYQLIWLTHLIEFENRNNIIVWRFRLFAERYCRFWYTSAGNAVIVLRALYDENNSGVDKGLFRRGMIRIRANIEN